MMDLLHCAVYWRTAKAIKMVSKVDIFCIVVLFADAPFYKSPGPPSSGNAHGIAPSTVAPPWLMKWPAMEVHSFGVTDSFI